jgi:hypothetical protein
MSEAQGGIMRLKAILTKKDAAYNSFSTQSNELLASMQNKYTIWVKQCNSSKK